MGKNSPLVSIITPAFNCENVFAQTIESVLSQDYSNWEMIIVDDCSTDSTRSVAEAYARMDGRIRVYSLSSNSGSSEAKNFALSKAKGRFIAFLDSDDVWPRNKIQRQLQFMTENGYAFSFTAYEFMKTNDPVRKVLSVPKSVNYKQYLRNTIIGNSTVMMDAEMIPGIRVQSGYLEDVLTWMFYLKKGFVAYGLNENLMSYRISIDSKSGKKIKNSQRYFKCLREQQKLGFLKSCFYFLCYSVNATKKRLFAKKRIV